MVIDSTIRFIFTYTSLILIEFQYHSSIGKFTFKRKIAFNSSFRQIQVIPCMKIKYLCRLSERKIFIFTVLVQIDAAHQCHLKHFAAIKEMSFCCCCCCCFFPPLNSHMKNQGKCVCNPVSLFLTRLVCCTQIDHCSITPRSGSRSVSELNWIGVIINNRCLCSAPVITAVVFFVFFFFFCFVCDYNLFFNR